MCYQKFNCIPFVLYVVCLSQLSQEVVSLSGQARSEVNQYEDGPTLARLSTELNTLQAERYACVYV